MTADSVPQETIDLTIPQFLHACQSGGRGAKDWKIA